MSDDRPGWAEYKPSTDELRGARESYKNCAAPGAEHNWFCEAWSFQGEILALSAEVERLWRVLEIVADGFGTQDHTDEWHAAWEALRDSGVYERPSVGLHPGSNLES